MKIIVSCTDEQKKELTSNGLLPGTEVIYVHDNSDSVIASADALLDLQFENSPAQIELLREIPVKVVIVNSVVSTLAELHPSIVRINAWPAFLSSALIEGSCGDDEKRKLAETALAAFNKKIEWLPDDPGFVTARVISMIINEAYFAFSEGISTKEEIDTAMKLGTNYPYGPFEWAQKIGLENIVTLLNNLSSHQSRYAPCRLLTEESESSKVHQIPLSIHHNP
jgi:3-hydroxybutyryl-CoA dehydrogenase